MENLRSRLGEAIAVLGGLLAEATAAGVLPGLRDEDLLTVAGESEDLGRRADAFRVAVAGELGDRSRPILGPTGLASRKSCGSATELLERTARITPITARQRLKLGKETRPSLTLTGQPLPAEYDAVRIGLRTGRLGLDSARIITRTLGKAAVGLPTDLRGGVHAGEHELVAAAIGAAPAPDVPALPPLTPVETQVQADTWAATLNPDGAEPTDRVFNSRGFWLHAERGGLIPVSGLLLPEVAGQVQRVFDTLTNPRQSLKFLSESERAELDASGARDPRSRAQRQHDALATVFDIAGRSGHLPTLGGASATMLVTVLGDDYAAGRGVGHVDGLGAPLAMAAIRQLACANGIQPIELLQNGTVLRLGTTERTFNRAQRRALAVRDGGCIIPGCGYPAWATEAHHVIPWEIEKRTHIDNGVLLCWFHHRTIETSGWRIRMVRGAPEVMPPPGMGAQVWRPSTKSPTRLADHLARRLRN